MAGMLLLGAAPSHNGGLAQVGLWFPEPTFDWWAINACKQQVNAWVASAASNTNWPSLIDDNGYPTAIPAGAGAKWISSQLYIYGASPDIWVLDWVGTATLGITTTTFTGGGLSESVINSNRREYTITGTPLSTIDNATAGGPLLISLQITAITSLSNIRLYRKVDETLINGSGATAIFHPDFLTRVKQFGVLRFMDWAYCNFSRLYKWADRNTETDYKWAGQILKGKWFYGTATQSLNKQTVSTLPTLTNGLIVQFWMPVRPINKVITATVTGATTQFTITAHGFTTGDKVEQDGDANGGGSFASVMTAKSSTTGLPPEYTVTVVDPDTITINLNSTGFAAPTGTFRILPQIQISDGTVTKRCLRKGMTNYFNSEFAGFASGGHITAVYDSLFDVFVMSGNENGDRHIPGIPLSAMITLANYCRAHPWFSFNFMTDDATWTQIATTVKAGLTAGLIPRFESGNEIWNPGNNFWQTAYARSVAGVHDSSLSADLAYGDRTAQVSDLIKAVYGSGTDWKMIMAVQAVSSVSTNRFQGNARINGGSSAGYPLNKCDAIAFGPYLYAPFTFLSTSAYTGFVDAIDNYNIGNTSTAFDWMKTELTTPTIPAYGNVDQALDGYINVQTPRWVTAATGGTYTGRNGTVAVTHYEGGIGPTGADSIDGGTYPATATSGRSVTVANIQAFWPAFLESQQAADFVTSYVTRSVAAGVTFPAYYTVAGLWSNSSTWGAYRLNNTSAGPTLQYIALLNWNNGL